MSDATPLFRQAALDRLTSPDQLDHLIRVTSPLGWLALSALGTLCAAVVAWAVLGDVATRVGGDGILVAQGGGVVDAIAPAPGILISLAVHPGDRLTKGQMMAELVQPAARQTLEHARDTVRDLHEEHARLAGRLTTMVEQRRDSTNRQRMRLAAIAAAAQQRADFYHQQVTELADPASRSTVTRQRLQDLRQGGQDADQEILRVRGELARLETEEIDASDRRDAQLAQSRMRVADAERRLGELADSYAATSRVLAPADGEVIELKAAEGIFVTAGSPLASLETGTGSLEAVLFVPPEHGKQIRVGMAVQIAPATVRREEFGTIMGRVVSISDFPASASGMEAVLRNAELVRRFSRDGPPYAARIALATNDSGYIWSSGQAPMPVTSGTLVSADVTIEHRRPIALVLPFLDAFTGRHP